MQDITIDLSSGFYEIYSKVHKSVNTSNHEIITPAHFLLEMINNKSGIGYSILVKLGSPIIELNAGLENIISEIPKLESGKPRLSENLAKVLDSSLITAQSLGGNKIDSGHFLIGILRNMGLKEYSLLRSLGVNYSDVLNILKNEDVIPKVSTEVVNNPEEVFEEEKLEFKDVFKIISPIFFVIAGIAVGLGIGLFSGYLKSNFFVFLFVIISWVISVSVHEYGHAFAAYFLGDLSIRNKGYLSLNPLKYTNGFTSIIFPILILALGGIGLPGGAVYVNFGLIRSKRARTIVSAAGPLMQTFFVFFLLAIYYSVGSIGLNETNQLFWSAFSFLLFLQITSIFFNLIPLPPLDGFGIILPFIPKGAINFVALISRYTMWIIFAVFMTDNPIQENFWGMISSALYMLGISGELVMDGLRLFQFWR